MNSIVGPVNSMWTVHEQCFLSPAQGEKKKLENAMPLSVESKRAHSKPWIYRFNGDIHYF